MGEIGLYPTPSPYTYINNTYKIHIKGQRKKGNMHVVYLKPAECRNSLYINILK